MASSLSSTQKSYLYDVFLNFRGEDTRKSFVDHLYVALECQGVEIFKDDEKLEKGKMIKAKLMKSIEQSKLYIIVFSKDYASSSWCLDELVKIMECQKATTEQIAYPVFYDVSPTEVRRQRGPVGKAFATHRNILAGFKWRRAMREAADLSGWDLRKTENGHEAKVIKKIVQKISLELRFTNLKEDEYIEGMESRVNKIISSLKMDVEDVRMIGIKGMGGGGKTTLARAVFDKICFLFEGKSFVEDVREASKASMFGLCSLQEQVLSNVLKDRSFTIKGVHDGKSVMRKMLCGKKVLLVLDDVDHLEQLKALAGGLDWFKPGSRIIITTRDMQVLLAHRVHDIQEVKLLAEDDAMRVFSRYAFGRDIPVKEYKELSLQAVTYADGLPLAIRVLGSFLCGLDKLEWEDALERLKTIPLQEVLGKLEFSYTMLEDDYKEIFLDVACLMKGWKKEDAIRALESCGFHARSGLRILEQKSLITVSADQKLGMHDRIEEMSQNIVRRLHPDEPIRHIRLWIRGEIEDVLCDDLVNEATRGITTHTNQWWGEKGICCKIVTEGFGNMKKLRFLHVVSTHDDFLNGIEVGKNLPNELRFMSWQCYPHFYLPKTFQANNLVALEMSGSDIKQLWEEGEKKVLNKLKFLDLSHSQNLTTLDCGLLPNLEKLNLKGCYNLEKLHLPIGSVRRLVHLDIHGCRSLIYVSFIKQLESLQVLENLRFLDYSDSSLTALDCGLFPNIENLNLEQCEEFEKLHVPIGSLRRLVDLNLMGCMSLDFVSFIKQLESIQIVENLKFLNLSCSSVTTLDCGLFPNLEKLFLKHCENLVKLHVPIGSIRRIVHLDLECCKSLDFISFTRQLESHQVIENLRFLNLSYTSVTTLNCGLFSNLEILVLKHCENLVKLHVPIGSLRRLVDLNLTGWSRDFVSIIKESGSFQIVENLRFLNLSYSSVATFDCGLFPNLEKLKLAFCSHLVKLNAPVESLRRLVHLDLRCCKSHNFVSFIKQLKSHQVAENLRVLNLSYSSVTDLDCGLFPNLEKLKLAYCFDLVKLNMPIGSLRRLVHLNLHSCKSLDSVSFIKQLRSHQVLENLRYIDYSHSSLKYVYYLFLNVEKVVFL